MFKLTGTIKVINPTQVVSEKFSKREFVIETQDQYAQVILFQLTQDKCTLLDNVKLGDIVNVSFNLRGKSWVNAQGETKYFNTLEAWKIDVISNAPQVAKQEVNEEEDDDGLPF